MTPVERLTKAAADGDLADVDAQLRSGTPVDGRDREHRTALDRAVLGHQTDVVRLLLAAGADPGQAIGPHQEALPLINAAVWGDEEMARLLLAAGAEPDAQHLSSTALTGAAQQGHVSIVRLLLDHGASRDGVDHRIDGKGRPLYNAASSGRDAVVGLLLERGAEATAADVDIARWAAIHGRSNPERRAEYRQALTRLREARGLPGEDPTLSPTAEQWAATEAVERFVRAATDGHREQVMSLLSEGVPVDARNERHRGALDGAVMGNHPDVVEALLAAGADTSLRTGHYLETTPLLHAAMHGYPEVARLLIEAGACLNPWPDRMSPLGLAAAQGHLDVVRLLLDHGASPTEHGRHGPVMRLAATYGRPEVVRLLLDRGIQASAQDLRSARQAWTRARTNPEILTSLAQSPAELDQTVALLESAVPESQPGPVINSATQHRALGQGEVAEPSTRGVLSSGGYPMSTSGRSTKKPTEENGASEDAP